MNDKSIRLRPADADDATALAEILTSVGTFDAILPPAGAARVDRVATNLRRLVGRPGHDLLLAETAAGSVAGYLNMHSQPCLSFDGEEGFVSELFVHGGHSGKGIGSLLLDEAVRLGRERGWWRLHLVNNREAESYRRGFYQAQGWTERERMADFVLLLKQ